jgi:hypothetical protein
MSARTLVMNFILAGAVGVALTACSDKSEDTGEASDGGSSDGGTSDGGTSDGGSDDGGSGDGGSDDFFEPDVLIVSWGVPSIQGVMGGVTYGGKELTGSFSIWLVDSNEDFYNDDRYACLITYTVDETTATDLPEFVDNGAWQGWLIDTSGAATTEGACDDLDPDVHGDPAETYGAAYTWGIGFGPVDSAFSASLADAFSADYATYQDNFTIGYIYTDLTGTAGFSQIDYGLTYSVDDDGELVFDSSGNVVFVDVSEAAFLPDGYNVANPFSGWYL